MPGYDFSTLSPIDFEELCRDLLQKELNLTLESFAKGRDQGIDLRFCFSDGQKLVVQCKHFVGSGFSSLLSAMKKDELKKLQALKPRRYILITSVALTPQRKSKLKELLVGYCKSEKDIIGADEINAMLARFPLIEESHFKLWLTSVPILQRVLHAKIKNFSEYGIDEIEDSYKRYIQIPMYSSACRMLDAEGHCIITGIPGAGKTTLAHVLIAKYLAQDYQIVSISGGFAEVWQSLISVRDAGQKQIFFLDDFLGESALQIRLDAEQATLFRKIIEFVRRNPQVKLIFTTREYILERAKQISERVSVLDKELVKCVVDLAAFTPEIKARILFNHLYYSEIDTRKKRYLVRHKYYLWIISHPNFNPRLIEAIAVPKAYASLSSEEYVSQIRKNLDNPERIWDHPFTNQIGTIGQTVLYLLLSFEGYCLLNDLKRAYLNHEKLNNHDLDHTKFDRAIEVLDGTFVHTSRHPQRGELLVRFHNPSVKDYVVSRLSVDQFSIEQLLAGVFYIDQIKNLFFYQHLDQRRIFRAVIISSKNLAIAAILRCVGNLRPYHGHATIGVGASDMRFVNKRSAIEGMIYLCNILDDFEEYIPEEIQIFLINSISELDQGDLVVSMKFLADLFIAVVDGRWKSDEKFQQVVAMIKERTFDCLKVAEDFSACYQVLRIYQHKPAIFDLDECLRINDDLERVFNDIADNAERIDDSNEASEILEVLDRCRSRFGSYFGYGKSQRALEERRDQLERQESKSYSFPKIEPLPKNQEVHKFDVEGFFDKLI